MSSNDEAGLLAEYALGTLDDEDEITRARELTESHPSHASEFAALQSAVAGLAFALDPVAPSTDTRDRLLGSSKGGRFAQFAETFSQIFDVTVGFFMPNRQSSAKTINDSP